MPTVVVLCLSLLSAAASKPLAIAYRDGDIAVHCASFAGHTLALLKIQNLAGNDLLIDVNASYMVPADEGVQRLALALLKTGSSDTTLRLAAAGQTEVKVLCLCMDASKATPTSTQKFILAKRLAPRRALTIVKDWKLRPNTPQTTVQSAIWGHIPSIKAPSGEAFPEPAGFTSADFQTTREYALHGKNLYALTADGNLFRGTTDAPLSLLERKCVDLFSDGRLFAIRNIPCRSSRARLLTVVSALDSDTSAWADLFESEPGKILWVDASSRAAIVQTLAGAVARVEASKQTPLLQHPRAIAVSPEGTVFWVPADAPSELRRLAADGQPATVHRHEARLLSVISPDEFPHALDCRGNLLRFEDGKVRQVRNDVLAIEPLNGKWLVMTRSQPRGHEQVPGRIYLCGGESPVLEFTHPAHLPRHYLCQPRSSALFSIDAGLALRQYDGQQQTWQRLGRLAR